jgi:hypothetical protein
MNVILMQCYKQCMNNHLDLGGRGMLLGATEIVCYDVNS